MPNTEVEAGGLSDSNKGSWTAFLKVSIPGLPPARSAPEEDRKLICSAVYCLVQWRPVLVDSSSIHTFLDVPGRILRVLG